MWRLNGELPVAVCLSFCRRDVPDGSKQSMMVEARSSHSSVASSTDSRVLQQYVPRCVEGLGYAIVNEQEGQLLGHRADREFLEGSCKQPACMGTSSPSVRKPKKL
jgi:hypothetical protein